MQSSHHVGSQEVSNRDESDMNIRGSTNQPIDHTSNRSLNSQQINQN